MKNINVTLLALAIAVIAAQGALGVETPLTDYSRAVISENPMYYWTFNEAGATDVANDVMRYESAGSLLAIGDATRDASYSSELGTAASFNDNAAFATSLINRGKTCGAYAVEFWMKSDPGSPAGYIADFLGSPVAGDSPGIISNYNAGYTELWYGGARTGTASQLNVSDGQWHHVVMAVNSDSVAGTLDQIDVAIDGVVTTNIAAIDAKQMNLTGDLCIGAWATTNEDGYATAAAATGAGSSFQGKLDEFAIYELGDMDATEVAAKVASLANHYNLATAPVASTPFAAVPGSEISYAVVEGNQPSATYDDSTGDKLTNGVFAGSGSGSYASGEAVGYHGDHNVCDYTIVEFDLGEERTLDSVWVDHLSGGRYGINAPASIEISVSSDGTNFSAPVFYDDIDDSRYDPDPYFNERCDQIDLDGADGQYVRVKFNAVSNFNFISEVRFMETAEVPEPGTIVLLISAFASLLIWRKAR